MAEQTIQTADTFSNDPQIAQLQSQLDDLRKMIFTHLGPRYAASSLNIPHPDMATSADLTALTTRVTTLETTVAALVTAMTTAGRYM